MLASTKANSCRLNSGTKRLKDFFSESLQNEEGDEVSTLEVKKILSVLSKLKKNKPLSDEKLKELLLRKV
ncbi:MAG: hypothetical protein U0T81_04760 [Saprospiraceae bacterium]